MSPKKGATIMDKIVDWIVAALLIVGLLGITATILWHMVIGAN
jgi:hypothetical protein